MTPRVKAPAPTFDPMPLVRQLEMTLPDLRSKTAAGWGCRSDGFDNGRKVVANSQIAAELGVSFATVQRWRSGSGGRLDRVRADLLATRAGFHPCELWTDWYEDVAS